jgi:hypothetical protein
MVFNLFLQSQKTGMPPIANAKIGKDESVAQLVEQYTFNVWVLGPSPSGFTSSDRFPKLETGFFVSGDFLLYAFRLYITSFNSLYGKF